jgi:hypothetical protein
MAWALSLVKLDDIRAEMRFPAGTENGKKYVT